MSNMQMSVIELADRHFGEYKIKNGQVIPTYCPMCHGGQNKDRDTFAVSLWNGAYNCMRGSCGGTEGNGKGKEGSFAKLCAFFNESSFEFSNIDIGVVEKKKVYKRPDKDSVHPLTDQIVEYFESRSISKKTLEDFKVGSDSDGNILFPFYRDGELVYVKHRPPYKVQKGQNKEWQDKDTEPILFGMDNVSFNKPLVITEGMIDALSVYEAGVSNVVSVPSGCNNTDWISNCFDWLDKFSQIVVFGDNDAPGIEMMQNLVHRLGEDRCTMPKEYPQMIYNGKLFNRDCKDANEILCCYGAECLNEIVSDCRPAPLKGVKDVSTINYVDPLSVPRIMSGIPALDVMIGGFGECGVTVISGQRGEGKSTISSTFLLNAINQGYTCCAYSAELSDNQFLDWTFLPATEPEYITYVIDKRSNKVIPQVPEEIRTRIRSWLQGKLWLFDNGYAMDENPQSAVLKVFEMVARRYGCKLFLVDNLMMLVNSTEEENKAQANFMAKLKAFANKYRVHVLCVCHPRKRKVGEPFGNDDVSGSSVITNIATTVFSIEKPNIRVTKNRDFGETGVIECVYDPLTRRIYDAAVGDVAHYGWNHEGIKVPDKQAKFLREFQPEKPASVNAPF